MLEGGHIKQIGFQGIVNECSKNQNKEAKAWEHGTNLSTDRGHNTLLLLTIDGGRFLRDVYIGLSSS